ncbi:MAG: 3-isopropylmalate dehydrogenase [Acidimicrobiia bacterium]
MSSHRIAVVPGDGTGPEVIAEAIKAVDTASTTYGFDVEYDWHDLGGDRYLRSGDTLTGGDLEAFRTSDAILFGAVGHPQVAPGILEQEIIIRMRRELDQYINLRPIKLHPGVKTPLANVNPEDVNFVVVRENSEGLYVDQGEFTAKGTPFEVATQVSENTRLGVEGCIRYAFDLASERPRSHLTMCGKTNVLTHAWDLWDRVFNEVGEEYPGVETSYAHVDAACLWMVEDPARFDVVVTDNMFGDIITDLGAAIQGGLGVASGANISPDGTSMFEPIGGTAPGFEGTGQINPLAAIGAAAMMLEDIGETSAAEAVELAVGKTAGALGSQRAGELTMTTKQIGDAVVSHIAAGNTALSTS